MFSARGVSTLPLFGLEGLICNPSEVSIRKYVSEAYSWGGRSRFGTEEGPFLSQANFEQAKFEKDTFD